MPLWRQFLPMPQTYVLYPAGMVSLLLPPILPPAAWGRYGHRATLRPSPLAEYRVFNSWICTEILRPSIRPLFKPLPIPFISTVRSALLLPSRSFPHLLVPLGALSRHLIHGSKIPIQNSFKNHPALCACSLKPSFMTTN